MPSILPTFPLNSKVQNKSRFKHVVDLRCWRDGVDILFAGHFAPESSHRQTTIDDDFLLLFRGSQIILHRDSNRIWDRRCISDGFWWKYTIYRREKGSELCVCECVCVCLRRSSLILLRPQLAILFRPRDMLPSHGGVLILSVFASVCDCGSVLRAPYLCTNIYFLFCKLLLTGAYFLENC